MIYRLNKNPLLKKDNMTLPVSVADACLCAHTAGQIKVMLWLYQSAVNTPVSEEVLSAELDMSYEEVADALDYWVGKGLVLEGTGKTLRAGNRAVAVETVATETVSADAAADDTESAEIAVPNFSYEKPPVTFAPPTAKTEESSSDASSSSVHPETAKRKVEAITVNPPTQTELVKRCRESQEIRELMSTTEERVGATLSFSMQSTLLMLHDDYGLPVEVIALAVEYAAGRKKCSSRYIANIGRSWCENEIDTVDKAMEYIENANSVERYWSEFREVTGATNPSPTKKQKEFLELWIKKMGFSMEMVGLAYEEMAERTGKFSFGYMNKILVNWQKNGIFTPADAQKAKQERFEKKDKKKSADTKTESAGEKSNASYDLDAYTKKAFSNPMNILKN